MQVLAGVHTKAEGPTVFQWNASSVSRDNIFFYRVICLCGFAFGILLFLAIRAGSVGGSLDSSGAEWIPLVIGLVLGFVGANLFIETQTVIDPMRRLVFRQAILLGRIKLFKQVYQFDDFKALILKRTIDPECSSDTILMGLRRNTGRRLWMRYWDIPHQSICEEAEWLATRVAKQIGVQIEQ